MKVYRALGMLAVFGLLLAGTPASANNHNGPEAKGGMHHKMGRPMYKNCKAVKDAKELHERVDAVIAALAEDHRALKAGEPSDELLAKLDRDLTDLEAVNADMRSFHEKMMGKKHEGKMPHKGGRKPCMKHKPNMHENAGQSEPTAPQDHFDFDVQHRSGSRGNWPTLVIQQ